MLEGGILWSVPGRGRTPRPPGVRGNGHAERREAPGQVTRVFLVEDEGVIAIDLRECLTGLGYEVCGTASRGDTALRMIAEERPDIVLMDIKLAGTMDGVEVARRLRETCHVPVVFLSAFADAALIARAAKSGCYGYLVKPFDERELHATLQIALARFRALR